MSWSEGLRGERDEGMAGCKTCELVQRRDAGLAPLWDSIWRTPCWDVVHALDSALPGWLVIVARRHIAAVDEMTEAEAAELGPLQRRSSLALREAVGCDRTYVALFAEASGHHHVHFHVVPRMPDMPVDYRGPAVFKYLGAPPGQDTPEAEKNRIASVVRRVLEGT